MAHHSRTRGAPSRLLLRCFRTATFAVAPLTTRIETSPLATLASRIGRHTTLYAVGSLVSVLFGLVNLAVLTRLLDPGPFGELAVLLFFSALLTITYNLGSLQGSFSWAFGTAADEGGTPDLGGAPAAASDQRRALFTGLIVTAVIALGGTIVIFVLARPLAALLLDDESAGDAVRWAAAAAAFGAVWRLVSNVLRLERRPGAYVVLNSVRPALALGIAIVLVAVGEGLEGAVAGIALGTGAAVAIGLTVTRRSYRVAISRADAREILRRGSPWILSGAALWAMQNADLFLLSRYVPESDVGVYRVAQRVGAVMSYAISAFMMAWGPLSRDPLQAAVDRERPAGQGEAIIAHYYVVGSLFLLLVLGIFSDELVRIAAASYSGAAPLIPLIGFGFVAYGAFVVVYRTSRVPDKRRVFVALTLVSAAAFAGCALVAIPILESYGAALAAAVGPLVGAAGFLVVSYRAGDPPVFDYRRIAGAAAIAAGCLCVGFAADEVPGPAAIGLKLLAVLAYPALLVTLEIVPRAQARALASAGRGILPSRGERANLEAHLGALMERDRLLLEWLVAQKRPVADVSRGLGMAQDELLEWFVRTLRALAGAGEPDPADADVGRYLVWDGHVGAKDTLAARLISGGVDPLDLDRLSEVLRQLRRILRRRGIRPVPGPADLVPSAADPVGDAPPSA